MVLIVGDGSSILSLAEIGSSPSRVQTQPEPTYGQP